jgi:hypothetical protein
VVAASIAFIVLVLFVVLGLLTRQDARERHVRVRDSIRDGVRQVDVFDWLP